MTTLRAQIQELDRLLTGHQEDEQERLAVGRTRQAAAALAGQADRLARFGAAIVELRQAGVAVPQPADLEKLTEAIGEARDRTREDPLDAGRGDEPTVVSLAKSVAGGAKAAIQPAWRELREAMPRPLIDEELLDLAVMEKPELRDRFELATMQLEVLVAREEPVDGDVTRWSQSVGVLRAIEEEASAAAPADDVREFLRAASSRNGASLDHLDSPDVAAWLQDPERRARYRIVAPGR